MKTVQILFLSFTLFFFLPSQASLHNNNNVNQICLSCDEAEGFSSKKYPEVFTLHKLNGKPHSFHPECLLYFIKVLKKLECPKCQDPLSTEQIARIEFAHGFPVDVAKKLETSDFKKLGDHFAKKAEALSKKATKLFSPENKESLISSMSTVKNVQLEQRIRVLEKTIEKTTNELNDKNREFEDLLEQFDAKCAQVQNLYEQLAEAKINKQ